MRFVESHHLEGTYGLIRNKQQYQAWLDKSTPYVPYRWLATFGLLMIFFIRIFVAQGWYIGMLTLGCFARSQLICFHSGILSWNLPSQPLSRIPSTQVRPLQ